MKKPKEDPVENTSPTADTGAGSNTPPSSPEPCTTAAAPAGPSGSAAGDGSSADDVVAAAEAVVAEVLEADAEQAAGDVPSADEVAQAKAEAAEWQDKYLRLHAEWDTYRRRTNEQREAERARATEKLVENLLPVIDDFERTIDYAVKNGETGLLSGVEAVHTKFVDVLVRGGVTVIDPAGEPFNALEAQAVAMVDDPTVPDETVAEVYQKGYKMGTKVLRPAMVTVATGGVSVASDEATE